MKRLMFVLTVSIALVCPLLSFATPGGDDDKYVLVDHPLNRVVIATDIFPIKFKPEQITELREKGKIVVEYGVLSVDEGFKKTLPNTIQLITGTPEWQSETITFTKQVIYKSDMETSGGALSGTYHFASPSLFQFVLDHSCDFSVTYVPDAPIRLFNLMQSVLGDRDFTKSETQPISDVSFFSLVMTDDDFIRQTTDYRRLLGQFEKKLLVIDQLIYERDIFSMKPEGREKKGKRLLKEYLKRKNKDRENLGLHDYLAINNELRQLIVGHFDLTLQDIPTIDKIMALEGGQEAYEQKQIFFLK